jgi:hypothetical protein
MPAVSDHSRLLLRLLVAAVLVQDLVWVFFLRGSRSEWPDWPAIVGMGLAFGQVGLAALLVLAAGPGRWQRAAVAAAFCFFAAYLAYHATGIGLWMWRGIMLLNMAIVAAPLAVGRLLGVRVVPPERLGELPPTLRQYSIRSILVLTTFIAVQLGIARAIGSWGDVGAVAHFATSLGAICCCGPLMISGWHWRWAVLAGALVCPVAGYVMSVTGFPPNDPAELIAMSYVQGLLTLAACAVVRLAGYRLVGYPGSRG